MDKVPFPQANDLQKVLNLLTVNDESLLSNVQFMSVYLDGITNRQVSYYISAAMYLGLVDREKRFTETGDKLRKMDDFSRIIELIRILISDPIIGRVYISSKVLQVSFEADDIVDIIKSYYPDYTEPLYHRRAQTVRSWIAWIEEHLSD